MSTEEMEDLRFLLKKILSKLSDTNNESFNKSLMFDAGCRDYNIHTAMLIYNLNKRIAGE